MCCIVQTGSSLSACMPLTPQPSLKTQPLPPHMLEFCCFPALKALILCIPAVTCISPKMRAQCALTSAATIRGEEKKTQKQDRGLCSIALNEERVSFKQIIPLKNKHFLWGVNVAMVCVDVSSGRNVDEPAFCWSDHRSDAGALLAVSRRSFLLHVKLN